MKALALIAVLLVSADDSIRSRRVLMFHASYCGPCKLAIRETEEWMRPSGWSFGDTADCHVQYIDAERDASIVSRFKVESLPTFIMIDNEKETARKVGYDTTQPIETRRRVIVDLFGK